MEYWIRESKSVLFWWREYNLAVNNDGLLNITTILVSVDGSVISNRQCMSCYVNYDNGTIYLYSSLSFSVAFVLARFGIPDRGKASGNLRPFSFTYTVMSGSCDAFCAPPVTKVRLSLTIYFKP